MFSALFMVIGIETISLILIAMIYHDYLKEERKKQYKENRTILKQRAIIQKNEDTLRKIEKECNNVLTNTIYNNYIVSIRKINELVKTTKSN